MAAPAPSAAQEEIRQLEDARYDALVACDVEAFAGYCHPELTYTHSSAIVDTRESYLDKCRGGYYRYHSVEHPIDKILIRGDVALVFGQMRADLTVGGVRKGLDNVCLAVWARTETGWKLLAYQPTVKPATT